MVRKAYSVSQVNAYVKGLFERDGLLRGICIQGEVSNCKLHPSGHLYFTLKDSGGQLSCVMWESARLRGLSFDLREGQKVEATGDLTVYERGGTYQLSARSIRLAGVGQLYERYEALKRSLALEGLFAPEHKQPLPRYPRTVGIVTASSGAALQDIRNILHRRNPYVQPILAPAQVQGFGAAESVVRGLRRLCALGVDVIIVARGGGSIEDLWAFNEEAVARAVYECPIPVISGVGHETDTTIIDYVSDRRAPTPSAAAELAVCESEALEAQLVDLHSDLTSAMMTKLSDARSGTELLRRLLTAQRPQNRLLRQREERERLGKALRQAMEGSLRERRHELALLNEKLRSLSPLRRIGKGYGYLTDGSGRAVETVDQLAAGSELRIYLADGTVRAIVAEIEKEEEVK